MQIYIFPVLLQTLFSLHPEQQKKNFSFLSCEHIYFDHAVFVHKIFNTKKITVIYGFGCKKKDFSSLSCEHIYFYHAPDPTFIFPSLFLASTPHATSSYLTSFNINLSQTSNHIHKTRSRNKKNIDLFSSVLQHDEYVSKVTFLLARSFLCLDQFSN